MTAYEEAEDFGVWLAERPLSEEERLLALKAETDRLLSLAEALNCDAYGAPGVRARARSHQQWSAALTAGRERLVGEAERLARALGVTLEPDENPVEVVFAVQRPLFRRLRTARNVAPPDDEEDEG